MTPGQPPDGRKEVRRERERAAEPRRAERPAPADHPAADARPAPGVGNARSCTAHSGRTPRRWASSAWSPDPACPARSTRPPRSANCSSTCAPTCTPRPWHLVLRDVHADVPVHLRRPVRPRRRAALADPAATGRARGRTPPIPARPRAHPGWLDAVPGMRIARPFDGTSPDGRPEVRRPDVPGAERDAMVRYLEQAPIVLAARSYDGDALDPDHARNVPLTYHTDGTWIWPGAVGYYLRAHGVPPEPDLAAHIRQGGFGCRTSPTPSAPPRSRPSPARSRHEQRFQRPSAPAYEPPESYATSTRHPVVHLPVMLDGLHIGYLWAGTDDRSAGFVRRNEFLRQAYEAPVVWSQRLRDAYTSGLPAREAIRQWIGRPEDPRGGGVPPAPAKRSRTASRTCCISPTPTPNAPLGLVPPRRPRPVAGLGAAALRTAARLRRDHRRPRPVPAGRPGGHRPRLPVDGRHRRPVPTRADAGAPASDAMGAWVQRLRDLYAQHVPHRTSSPAAVPCPPTPSRAPSQRTRPCRTHRTSSTSATAPRSTSSRCAWRTTRSRATRRS